MTTNTARRSGRDARVRARTTVAPVYLPAVNRQIGPINLLGPEGVEKIRKATMKILGEIAIVFRDARALAHWKQAGARVEGERVHILQDLLLDLISAVPSRYTFNARNPAHSVPVGDNFSIFANCYGSPFVCSLDGERRSANSRRCRRETARVCGDET